MEVAVSLVIKYYKVVAVHAIALHTAHVWTAAPFSSSECSQAQYSPSKICKIPRNSKDIHQTIATTSTGASIAKGQVAPTRGGIAVRASLNQLGDFGARDATASELESKFGDRVLGNASTEHIILIPPHLLGLAERTITPLAEGTEPLSQDSAKALLRKVLAWRLVDEGGLRIECEWKLKSFSAGIELFKRIAEVAEAAGHHPDLHLQQGNRAKVSVWTHSLGGLTENDFILAAKIDRIPTSDLIYKKNKFWA